MYSKKRDDVPCCWVPRREFRWIASFHTLAFWRPEGLTNWPINYGHWYRRDPHWQSSGHLSHLKNREIMTNTIRKILHWMCLVWLYQKKKIFWPLVIHLELLENGERFAAFLFDKIILKNSPSLFIYQNHHSGQPSWMMWYCRLNFILSTAYALYCICLMPVLPAGFHVAIFLLFLCARQKQRRTTCSLEAQWEATFDP